MSHKDGLYLSFDDAQSLETTLRELVMFLRTMPYNAKARVLATSFDALADVVKLHLDPETHDASKEQNAGDRLSSCRWCAEGNPRVPSSVSHSYVHTDTPVGRVVCSVPETPQPSVEQSSGERLSPISGGGASC